MQTAPIETALAGEIKPCGDACVWLLVGSQEMYGAEALAQVEAQRREVADALDTSALIPVRILASEVATTSAGILRVCQAANASEDCVGLIVWMHTFSPARIWIAGLQALRKPLLHLHTQFNRELPWSQIDMDFMNLNQSAHGDREFAHLATRLRLRRKTVVGHWQDTRTLDRIGTWCRAAYGWREAQALRVARFGDNMRNVAVTDGDRVDAQTLFGMAVDGFGVGDLVDEVAAASADEVATIVGAYDRDYLVVPELRRDGARRDSLIEAARIEAGLRRFLQRGGYAAFTDTFEDLHGLRQLPGIAVQRLMRDGYGFGGEGDWKTAALLRTLKSMGRGLVGGTSFIEDYTYDLTPGDERVLGSHMLEVCPSLAGGRPRCEIHPLGIGGKEDPVRLVFDAAPGPALLVSLLDLGSRFRLVANEVELLPMPSKLPRLPVARALWRPQPDFFTATQAWLTAGAPHHSVLTASITLETVQDLARIWGVELLSIARDSTLEQLLTELRWNESHFGSGCL